jgi:hypothetical protein
MICGIERRGCNLPEVASIGNELRRGRRNRQRLESFLRRSGMMSAVAPDAPAGWTPPLVLKHPKTLAGTGGRAGAGFLPGIQKPAPARLIRPDEFQR